MFQWLNNKKINIDIYLYLSTFKVTELKKKKKCIQNISKIHFEYLQCLNFSDLFLKKNNSRIKKKLCMMNEIEIFLL